VVGLQRRKKGKVFVYERAGAQWTVVQELQPSGLRWNDGFGFGVALDGEVLVIGASGVDSPGEDNGAVFIYEKSGSNPWGLASVFPNNDLSGAVQPTALLGRSVAVSGATVVAGAPAAGAAEGEVWVFERDVAGWEHTAILVDPAPGPGDNFGKSVAVYGDTVVAGEGGQTATGFAQGTALIFEREAGGNWQLVQEIEASDGFGGVSSADGFGEGVAIEGDIIVVAAPAAHGAVGPSKGAVYQFDRSAAGTWSHHETRVMVSSDPTDSINGEGLDLRDGVVFAGSPSYPRTAYVFEIESGVAYCEPAANSSGWPAHLAAVVTLDGEALLSAHHAPSQTAGVFLASPARDETVFQPSSLCLGAGMWRIGPMAPTGGSGAAILDLAGSPGLVSGVTIYFQYWFRDTAATTGGFNLSNAVAVALP